MAAARNATTTTPKNGRGASRLSFAKISDTLTVPDLLALQTESFDWLVGNDIWKDRLAEATEQGRTDLALHSGLEEFVQGHAGCHAGILTASRLAVASSRRRCASESSPGASRGSRPAPLSVRAR